MRIISTKKEKARLAATPSTKHIATERNSPTLKQQDRCPTDKKCNRQSGKMSLFVCLHILTKLKVEPILCISI
jgi:hypothetical protein